MTARPNAENEASMLRAKFKKPAVIINMSAKSTSDITGELTSIFERLNHLTPAVHLTDAAQLSEKFEAIKADDTDLLIVFGGDGTCKSGAIVAREMGIPIIALPGGTMNMLPKALYGTDNWQSALELALAQKEPRWQSAGYLNHHIFFCGAIIGDPVTMSEARESLRGGDMLEAVKQVPEIMTAIAHGDPFEFKVDGKVFDRNANGLQIYCPFMTSGATSPNDFELASVPQLSMAQLIGIGAKALTQDWRESAHVKTAYAKRVEINGQGAFDILLDGEPETVSCPVNIHLEEQGVLVLAPDLNMKAS